MKTMTMMAAMAAICISMPAMAVEKAMEKNTPEHMKQKTQYWFNKVDADHDGMITKSEHDAFGEKMFMESDANGDGKVSMDEMMAAKKKEMEEMKMQKSDMGAVHQKKAM